MNFGYHCRGWGSGGFVRALKDISDLGYEGFEAFSDIVALYEDRLNVFSEIIGDLHLQMAAVHGTGDFTNPAPEKIAEDIEHNMNTARFIKENGSGILVLSGAKKPEQKKDIDNAWSVFLEIIEEIGERCAAMGIKCCFHPQPDSLLSSHREIDMFMKKTKVRHVGLCVDTGAMTRAGVKLITLLKDYKKRIHLVHFTDCVPRRTMDKKKNKRIKKVDKYSKYCELGKGSIDFVKIVDTLHDINYDDWVIVELEDQQGNPAKSAETSINYARKHLGLVV